MRTDSDREAAFEATWARLERDPFVETFVPDETCTATPLTATGAPAVSLPQLIVDGPDGGRGEFELGAVLGRGGTAVVYAAEHRTLGRTVAIKALRDDIDGGVAVDALLGEARIAGGLEHPNIVPVHALGLDGRGRPLMVMKRIDGEPWSVLTRQPDHDLWARWPGDALGRAVRVTLRVCDALSSAHARGIIHRDIKPSNVILGPVGEVYLVDWGLGVRLDADGTVRPPLGGTPLYMAPEMFDPQAALDVRTDVYLLGATLFEAVVGQQARDTGQLVDLVRAAHTAPPEIPSTVPAALGEILRRAMAPDRADRFPDVESMRSALVTFLEHRNAAELARTAEQSRLRFEARRREDADRTVLDRLLAEALFGFKAALAAWPDCTVARDGLERLLETSIADDVARGEVAAARRSIADLPAPRSDLEALVDSAADRADADRAELEASRVLRASYDAHAGRRARRTGMAVVLVLLAIGPLRGGIMRMLGHDDTDLVPGFRPLAPLALAAFLEVYLRRWVAKGPGALFNRRLLRLAQVISLGVGAVWFTAITTGVPPAEAVGDNLFVLAVAFGTARALLGSMFMVPLLISLVAIPMVHFLPDMAEALFALSIMTAIVLTERAWETTGISAERREG